MSINRWLGAVAASGNFVANGAKLELVIEDNKSNPTDASKVAEKLIDDG